MGGEADPDRAREILAAAEVGLADAVQMLGDIEDTRALDVVLAVARHPQGDIRAAALRSLGAMGDPRGVTVAIDALSGLDERLRAAAIDCLAELGGPEARAALAAQLAHPQDRVRAATALAWLRDERAVAPLLAVADEPTIAGNLYRTPVIALAWLADPSTVAPLRATLQRLSERAAAGGGWAERMAAEQVATALAMIGGDEAEEALATAQRWFEGGLRAYLAPDTAGGPFAFRAPPDPRRTVPRWSLELRQAPLPVREAITKFGGQPVWLDKPTWPLAADGGPMTFMAQFRVPDVDGLAYLFIDPSDVNDLDFSDPGYAGCLFMQPGPQPPQHIPQDTGPTYPSQGEGLERFVPRSSWRLVESVPTLEPGMDFPDWEAMAAEAAIDRDDSRDWNKLGGTPRYLQNGPPSGDWRFLFQFTAALAGFEMGDGAECYGLIDPDRRGLFLVESH
jgi:hypothetical protein